MRYGFAGYLLLVGLNAALLAVVSGCARSESGRVRQSRVMMGTTVSITIYSEDAKLANDALEGGFRAMEKVDALMSHYRPDSEVSRINDAAGKTAIFISADTFEVLKRAKDFSALTGGAFDVTVGPLVALFNQMKQTQKLPSPEEIDKARSLVSFAYLTLDPATRMAKLEREGMRLDLNAIAAGYAGQKAMDAIRAYGIVAALVDAGGEIYAIGAPPGRDGWIVAIASPGKKEPVLKEMLLLRDAATDTSGDYEQYVEIDGHHYSHVIDPRTGMPLEHATSVTILAPDPTTADALTTGVSVLGPEAGLKLVESLPNVECMIITGGDTPKVTKSPGFDRHLVKTK